MPEGGEFLARLREARRAWSFGGPRSFGSPGAGGAMGSPTPTPALATPTSQPHGHCADRNARPGPSRRAVCLYSRFEGLATPGRMNRGRETASRRSRPAVSRANPAHHNCSRIWSQAAPSAIAPVESGGLPALNPDNPPGRGTRPPAGGRTGHPRSQASPPQERSIPTRSWST